MGKIGPKWQISLSAGGLIILTSLLLFSSALGDDPLPSPRFGEWGFDISGENAAIKPGDDFFEFANGGWLARTPIPADKLGMSVDVLIENRTEEQLHSIMEEAAQHADHEPNDLQGKVGAFYRAFMDEDRIEALGSTPIDSSLAAIRAATTDEQIGALMGRHEFDFEGGFFDISIDADPKDPTRYAVFLSQAGLGLPDRDYYLQPAFKTQLAKYQDYAEQLLSIIGWPDAAENAARIVALETQIAQVSWTKTKQRDPNNTYNPLSVSELEAFTPGFPWKQFLTEARLASTDQVIVSEKSAFPKIAAIFADTPTATLQAWLAFSVVDNAAFYLSKPFADAAFEFRNKTLFGQPEQEVRWKRALRAVSGGDCGEDPERCFGTMNWAVGQLYAERYFPPETKAKVEALVANLKAAFHARLEHLDWMSPETKAEALKKLDSYVVKVGYPNKPRDYSDLVIRNDDLVGNVRRAAEADWAFLVKRLSIAVDRDEWVMTPQTDDAWNGPTLRDLVFPAAILQPPYFDPNADPAVNYGGIGAIIGHEITHGFDDEGREIDAAGVLRDWWTPQDAKIFETRAAMLGAQFAAFEPMPGMHINPQLTMGENIADLGGLVIALDAYHLSLRGDSAPVIDGYTAEQRLFLAYAQSWRGKTRDETLRDQLVSDVHSPRRFRVDGVVPNVDAWYRAFEVKPGDKLYLSSDQRVTIW
jgi:putative endopeptidase